VTKAVLFGIARRFGKFGRRLWHVRHVMFFVSCRENTSRVICGNRVRNVTFMPSIKLLLCISSWQTWLKRNDIILFSIWMKIIMQLLSENMHIVYLSHWNEDSRAAWIKSIFRFFLIQISSF
jgi:hypothetical protein